MGAGNPTEDGSEDEVSEVEMPTDEREIRALEESHSHGSWFLSFTALFCNKTLFPGNREIDIILLLGGSSISNQVG
mgnify:CR=1 FL=1